MDTRFTDWVHEADPDASHDDLNRWWTGVSSAADDEGVSVEALVALASEGPTHPEAEAQFSASFRKHDAGFRSKGHEHLQGVLAAASLLLRLDSDHATGTRGALLL